MIYIKIKGFYLFILFIFLSQLLGDGLADGLVALHAEVLEMLVPLVLLDDALQGLVLGLRRDFCQRTLHPHAQPLYLLKELLTSFTWDTHRTVRNTFYLFINLQDLFNKML